VADWGWRHTVGPIVTAGYGLPLACDAVLQSMPVSCHFRGCTVPLQQFVCDSVTLIAVLHFIFISYGEGVFQDVRHAIAFAQMRHAVCQR